MTPQDFLVMVNRTVKDRAPNLWALLDRMRTRKGVDVPDWPGYVFLPFSGWYALTSVLLHKINLSLEDARVIHEIAVAGTWRLTQDVVSFDPDLYDAILDTPLEDVPSEVLLRLPVWSVFIETPGLKVQDFMACGFWAMLEYDVKLRKQELRLFLLDAGEGCDLCPLVMRIDDGLTLEQSLTVLVDEDYQTGLAERYGLDVSREEMDASVREVADTVRKCLNLVLYVCAYGLPGRERGTSSMNYAPKPVRTKKGIRMFPAEKVTHHKIGEEIGTAIRRAREGGGTGTRKDGDGSRGTHARPRPHVRRAHWHGYWHGARKSDQRQFKLQWLPPMVVALADEEEKRMK